MQRNYKKCRAFTSCTYKQLRACKYRVGKERRESGSKIDDDLFFSFVFLSLLLCYITTGWLVFFLFRFGHRWAAIAKQKVVKMISYEWTLSQQTTRVPREGESVLEAQHGMNQLFFPSRFKPSPPDCSFSLLAKLSMYPMELCPIGHKGTRVHTPV